ncbi:MAG: TlpA family protein disulfide reductase [Calditrichaeota bacterium]|nr:TlpA family protein disulfide reductase [Calditrichota bacterium]
MGIVLFQFSAACQDAPKPDARGYIVKVGDRVDDFTLTFLDGTSKKLSQIDADVIVLNFFASWCVVCRKEIPHLESEIWQPLKNKKVMVIGVNYKEKKDVAEKARKEIGMTYPVALDIDGKIFERFARGGVTRNIVLNKNLHIIFLTRLFNPEEFAKMKKRIHKQMQSTRSAKQTEGEAMTKHLDDLAQSGKKIPLIYQGKHKLYLEGKIFRFDKKEMELGVSLFEDDIVAKKYDAKEKIFRIDYRHFDGVRIAVLPMTKFKVPAEVEKVVIAEIAK